MYFGIHELKPEIIDTLKIKDIIKGLAIIFLMGSCAPAYLPKPAEVPMDPYGSYIILMTTYDLRVTGELIAVEDDELIIRDLKSAYSSTYNRVNRNQIDYFKLRYSDVDHGWSIPSYLALTLSHGFWGVLSIPLNLAVTITSTVKGNQAYKYHSDDLTYDELRMFARFPQGLPPGFEESTK